MKPLHADLDESACAAIFQAVWLRSAAVPARRSSAWFFTAVPSLVQAFLGLSLMAAAGPCLSADPGAHSGHSAPQARQATQTEEGASQSAQLMELTTQALSLEFAQALRRAQRGDTEAAVQVGRSYQQGVGVAVNFKQADRWLRRAASQGSVEAVVAQGEAFEFGWGVAPDAERARLLYTWAAEQRNIRGFYALGRLYRTGASPIEPDPREAFKWHALAASHGHVMALQEKRAAAASLPKLALEYAGYRANAWERRQQAFEASETASQPGGHPLGHTPVQKGSRTLAQRPTQIASQPTGGLAGVPPNTGNPRQSLQNATPDSDREFAQPFQLVDVYRVVNQR